MKKPNRQEPKLLFLAWLFPPCRTSASIRTWNIAKHLGRLGWDITVVTPHYSVWRHIENPSETDSLMEQEGIKRILTSQKWRFLTMDLNSVWNQGPGWFIGGLARKISRKFRIDKSIGWIKPTEKACSRLNGRDVDLILASGPPFISFRLARHLSEKLKRPYVLDYRDPWAGNPHTRHPSRSGEEKFLLDGCSAAIIVSPSWQEDLKQQFHLASKVHLVPNGFDDEELEKVEPFPFGHFAIIYAGVFHPPKRVITPLMAALKFLGESAKTQDKEWFFHYYGPHEKHVYEESCRYSVEKKVIIHGNVNRADALSAVKGANVAVVITSIDEKVTLREKGIVTGKIYETLGLKTPMLIIAPDGSDINSIVETTGLAKTFSADKIGDITSFLEDLLEGAQAPQMKDVDSFSWKTLGRKMDSILRSVLESP